MQLGNFLFSEILGKPEGIKFPKKLFQNGASLYLNIDTHFKVLKQSSISSIVRRFLIFQENQMEANSGNSVAKCRIFVDSLYVTLNSGANSTGVRCTHRTHKTVTMIILFFSFVLFILLGKSKCRCLHS